MRTGYPHLTPALSAPGGGEGVTAVRVFTLSAFQGGEGGAHAAGVGG
jgi:hypothetical protein